MKKTIGLMAILMAASTVSAASLYEPFNEPLGSINNAVSPNGHTWYQVTSTGPEANITTGDLISASMAGLANSPNDQHLTWGDLDPSGDARADRLDIGGYSSGNLFFSMGFTVPDLAGYNGYEGGNSTNQSYTNGVLIAGFSTSSGAGSIGTAPFKLYIWRDPLDEENSYQLGATLGAAGNLLTNWSGDLTPGQTYFLVGEWTEGGSSGNANDTGTVKLWIDPSSSTFGTGGEPAHGPLDPADTSASDPNPGFTGYQAASFFVRQSQYAPSTNMQMDELRIGTTYAGVTGVQWTASGNGAWQTATNWSSGTVPNAQGADVTFDSSAAEHDVSLASALTAGTLRFNGDSNYTLDGTSTLTLDTPINGDLNIGTATGGGAANPAPPAGTGKDLAYIHNAANPAQIIVTPTSANVTHTISTPLYLNRSTALTVPAGSTLNLTGGVSANLGTTVGVWLNLKGGGNAVITPSSSAAFGNTTPIDNGDGTFSYQGLSGLGVDGNMKINPAHAVIIVNSQVPVLTSTNGNAHPNTITTFNLSAGSTLDLTNNDLIVNYTPPDTNNNPTDAVTGPAVLAAVASAYDAGKWDQPGLTSSVTTAATSLAAVDNGALGTNALTSVDGVTLDTSSVVVKYTWYGDLNLDGVVNNTDFSLMADNSPGWSGGDLNYDGVVNGDDWALFALGEAASGGANISSVPEPVMGAILIAGLPLLMGRGRRRRA